MWPLWCLGVGVTGDVWPRPCQGPGPDIWSLTTVSAECDCHWPLVSVLLTLFFWSGPARCPLSWEHLVIIGSKIIKTMSGPRLRVRAVQGSCEGGGGTIVNLTPHFNISETQNTMMNCNVDILGHGGILIVSMSPPHAPWSDPFVPQVPRTLVPPLPSCVSVFTPMLWAVSPSCLLISSTPSPLFT